MNQKGLTYFLLIVFLFSAGKVFPNSELNTGTANEAGSILYKAAGMTLLDFSIDEQTNPLNKKRIIAEYQFTPIEKISAYSHENYILSERHFVDTENTRRTNLWFTSRLRN